MQQTLALAAEKRQVIGKRLNELRDEGLLPAVVYGRAFDAIPVTVDAREFRHVYATAGGNQLIEVKIKGIKQPEQTLVREVQRDPVSREILHVDLYRVSMTQRITTEVAITLLGQAPAAEEADAMMFQGVSSLQIQCLPGDLPESIEVDLSTLVEIDQAIFVRDLAIGEGITVLTDADEMIARVSAVRMEIEEEEEEEDLELEEGLEAAEEGEEGAEAAAEEEPAD